jgi:hypothetical protein
MKWSRTLELAPQKFEKLTSTYGHVLSYARQGPDIKIFFKFFIKNLIAVIISLFPMNNSQK